MGGGSGEGSGGGRGAAWVMDGVPDLSCRDPNEINDHLKVAIHTL